ncbi:LLM class flavin-dependent oxidoreductase [Streptomyces sp. NPDC026672]|uniref:LLM class flavin-dependent oxidoreductase n=1 Tax=unclassified Streptomyces TaxID=2593676 RepID=UPI00340BF650
MPDFGHDLQFATFPEPVARPVGAPVDLALLSEQWGYDLVMFQDHPYRPGYLDAWTLMSWTAARTERIRIAPNVLNMAMRAPAMVAKAAASLDLLSGGRIELGLGAGHFWDEITTMGVQRRTSGQAVDALEEAIDVIRAAWPDGPSVPMGVEVPGHYHRLAGMRPGPPTAHPMAIWLGAYKPRMLRLTGQKADGWTALLGGTHGRAHWQSASTVIDEAATEAGRTPADIRRMAGITGQFTARNGGYLHGPPEQWVQELLPSILEDGVGTFVLATDHRPTLQRFATEVMPALRAAVTAERQSTRDLPAGGRPIPATGSS